MLETWPEGLPHAYGRIFQPDRKSFGYVSACIDTHRFRIPQKSTSTMKK
jgi:hypothetical protein